MPLAGFAVVTGVLAGVWVGLMLALIAKVGEAAPMLFERHRSGLWVVVGVVVGLAILWWARDRIAAAFPALDRLRAWEFWPAPVFYLPVAVWVGLLAIWHRSLTVPTCANPGMFTGGIIGESKIATLEELERVAPESVAAGFLIGCGDLETRLRTLTDGMARRRLDFPVVLKPDVGQRGSGFRLVRSRQDAEVLLATVEEPLIAQEYLPGPHEAGIFYYRHPGHGRGRIFSITRKVFPEILGDGRRTVRELILADPRARRMASRYFERLADQTDRVPHRGERVRLVHAGNHAQGCLFQDGQDWITARLEQRIDALSRGLDGFFVGRYDVRFGDPADLMRGEGFKILELNGAASEATNAYDASHSVFRAYAILFEQWRLVFSIGAANRRSGVSPTPARTLLREWMAYREKSRHRRVAD
jgi:hypothetical protein